MYQIRSLSVQVDFGQLGRVSDQIRINKQDFLRMARGPEHTLPKGVERRSLEHALYLTYTCLVDYNLRRIADDLWAASRRFFEDHPAEVYPECITEQGLTQFERIFRKYYVNIYRAPASPEKMAQRIFRAAEYFLQNTDGDPRKLLASYLKLGHQRDPNAFLEWVKKQKHQGLPNGDKVIKLWFRTMCEGDAIELGSGMWLFKRNELAGIPLPIDKNIISAGIALGLVRIVKGSFEGSFSEVKPPFHDAWLTVARKSDLLPLELDEPIWKIGRNCRRKKCDSDCFFRSVCPRTTDFMFRGEVTAPSPAWDILVWPKVLESRR